jgi:hypothetical protein
MSTLDLSDENPLQLDVIPWYGAGTENGVGFFGFKSIRELTTAGCW